MKMLASLAAGLGLLVLPAAAQDGSMRLAPPVNVVKTQASTAVEQPSSDSALAQRQSMVIEENGTVRFLTPEEAANLFLPDQPTSEVSVELDQPADAPDSLRIEVTGAEISESLTPDGSTRLLRVLPNDGSPAWLITITKD